MADSLAQFEERQRGGVSNTPVCKCGPLFISSKGTERMEAQVNPLRLVLLETFPEPNRRLLQRILKMHTIAAHASENRMTPSAVAACMAPLLLLPLLAGECELEEDFDMSGDNSAQLLAAANAANSAQAIVTTLLEEYDSIFDLLNFMEDIAEMKKKWDTWVATKGKDIVEKMKNWYTWDDATEEIFIVENIEIWVAIHKDLKTYLAEVFQRAKEDEQDESTILDFLFLKLILICEVSAVFEKVIQDFTAFGTERGNAYSAVVADIIKVLHNRDKLDDVLEAQTQLMDYEKEVFREDWEKQHAVETEGDENSVVVEDSNMGEYLKAKFTELGNLKANIGNVSDKMHEQCAFRWDMEMLKNILKAQKIMRSQGLFKHEELIQNMMSAEDNCCSSTRAKKWRHASSEDNIVASSEDDICRQKRLKPAECL